MGNTIKQVQKKFSNRFNTWRRKVVELKQDYGAIHISSEEIVDSGRLATCYGIIIYDRERKEGVGAHFSSVDAWGCFDKKYLLGNLIEEIENNLGNPSKLEAYVSADGFSKDSFAYDYRLADRDKLFSSLKKLGINPDKIYKHFRNPEQSTSLRFTLKTGQNELTVYEGSDKYIYRGDLRKAD